MKSIAPKNEYLTSLLKTDFLWAVFLFGINVLLQSVYSIEVCPYVEGLNPIEIISVNLLISLVIIFGRRIYYRNAIRDLALFSARKLVLIDAIFLLSGGIIWGIYNNIIHDFPLGSTIKILTGFLSIGLLTGMSLFILRKVKMLQTETLPAEDLKLKSEEYTPMAKDFLRMAIVVIIIVSINGIFVLLKDLQWIVMLDPEQHQSAIKNIIIEIFFIAVVYAFYITLISRSYSNYLKFQLKNQTIALNEVSNGDLSVNVKVVSNDEFGVVANYTNQMIEQLRKHSEIAKSIEYAKNLQESILPSSNILNENLPCHFCLYKPKDLVSGDFYWTEKIGDVVLFAAADSTGHGVPGAMVSIICVNALNQAVKETLSLKPGEILTRTRELVIESFQHQNREVKDGMDISLCALNNKTNELQWAGAYNPLWVVSKQELSGSDSFFQIKGANKKERVLNEINPDRQPIGMSTSLKPFTNRKIQLNKGDVIYIFTDGYADQFGGENGKKFKKSALRKLFLTISSKPLEAQRIQMDEAFESWRGECEQVDDVCVIGLKL